MKKSFTQEDLIRLIYNETSAEETAKIKAVLAVDWELNEQYQQMLETKSLFKKASEVPSISSIDIILSYSKNTSPLEKVAK